MQKNIRRPKPRKMRKTPSPAKKLHSKIEEKTGLKKPLSNEQNWKTQYEDLNKKYHFLMAEYANYKKNCLKDMENLRKYEGLEIVQQLLSRIIDPFDRALEQKLTTQNRDAFKKGMLMIYENLKNLLMEKGIKEIECKGQPFDPAFHLALDSVHNEEVPPEHILYVIKKGYVFNDKLIRPAEVIVAKEPLKTKETRE